MDQSTRATLQTPRRAFPLALAAAVLLLGACGGSSESDATAATGDQTTSTGTDDTGDHNPADVAFATQMIPHHAQALTMADLAIGRRVSPELSALIDDIRAAQTPEIELMADWLQEWGEPVPETVRDHAHAGHGDDMGRDGDTTADGMAGMMDQADLDELADAPAGTFEEQWLEMMVEHHEGAVAMAKAERADGSFGPARDLADGIASSQTDEIARMQDLLDR